MALKSFRFPRFSLDALCPERRRIRRLLRKAGRGNVYAFVQVSSHYARLISEYLYLSGIAGKMERDFHLLQVLSDCWRYLPYTRRVSDFERFLQVRLETCQEGTPQAMDPPHHALSSLNHIGRFLLAARILNGWTNKSLRLALRINKGSLSEALMHVRCKLTGVETDKLTWLEQTQVKRVSELLEGGYSEKLCRKIETEVGGQYHALQFKADWLSYRCELADLQTDMSLTTEELNDLGVELSEKIKALPMEKPRLYDSLVNQISFQRLP